MTLRLINPKDLPWNEVAGQIAGGIRCLNTGSPTTWLASDPKGFPRPFGSRETFEVLETSKVLSVTATITPARRALPCGREVRYTLPQAKYISTPTASRRQRLLNNRRQRHHVQRRALLSLRRDALRLLTHRPPVHRATEGRCITRLAV